MKEAVRSRDPSFTQGVRLDPNMIRLPVVEILNRGHPKYVDSEMVIILVSKTKVLGSSPSRRATYSLLAQLVCVKLRATVF